MIAIKVNNLSRNFKLYGSSGKRALEYMSLGKLNGHTDFWALRDISFEVNGKVSAILELGSGFHPDFTGRANVNKYHALIAERERAYNEGNLEERGEILGEGYDVVYNFIDNLKNTKKKCLQPDYVGSQDGGVYGCGI